MPDPSTSLTALCTLTLLLGLRHGFDADHLAVIDGIARLNAADRPCLARSSGALFSLGHGTMVAIAACAMTVLAQGWSAPGWLDSAGVVTSVTFLIGLGIANLAAIWSTEPGRMVRPVGLRSRFVPKLRHPAAIFGVGALFAFSFDTLTQATLMALAGVQLGGILPALLAALCFVVGMLVTDGINGLWISRLLRSAEERAAAASRAMALVIGLVSLLIGGLGLASLVAPTIAMWADNFGLWLGLGVVLSAGATFAAAALWARPGTNHPV